MKNFWKRCLSILLAFIMVAGTLPSGVFAAEVTDPQAATEVGDTLVVKGDDGTPTSPTNVPGTHWEFVEESAETTCGKTQHDHTADCLYSKCGFHQVDGTHPVDCYKDAVWAVCTHGDACTATDTMSFNTSDGYMKLMQAIGTALTNESFKAFCVKEYGSDSASTLISKLPGNTYCFTAELDISACPHAGANQHTAACCSREYHVCSKPECYSYTWKLVYNTLSPIEVVFEGNTPGVTVTSTLPAEAKYNDNITFTLSATGDVFNTWTATINGKNPTKLDANNPTEVTASAITSGTIKVVLSSQPVPTYTINVVEENKLNGCAYTLTQSSNLLEGNTAELTVVVPSGDNSYKFTPSVSVSGAGASYVDGKITVGTENVTVTIDYQPKKLVVNNSTEDEPVEIPYNFGKGIADQEDEVKEAIFDALVNSNSSLPAGLTYGDHLTFEFYAVGKITGNYDSAVQALTGDKSLYNYFGERGNNCVEKIKITWLAANGLPEVFADVYVKLVDSRPDGVITVDNAAIGNITADEAGQVTEDAIRTALSGAISAELLNKLTITIGEINIVANGTPAVETTGSVSVTLTLPGTADYKETTKVVAIPVVNPVYNPTINWIYANGELKIYSDAACTQEVTDLTEVTPDTYYVKVVSTSLGYKAPTLSINEGTLALQTNGSYSFTVDAADLASTAKTYTITAVSAKNSYTVTWNPNGGNWNGSTDNKVDTVEFEGAVTQPADPTKEGYTFAGWEPTVNSTMSAANVEYIAQWTINQYTITFDSKGGPAVGSITKNYGEVISLPSPAAWTGYTFLGWYTDDTLTNKFVGNTMPAADTTLYAKWTEAESSISFNTDGGTAVEAIVGNYGDTVAKPADPTKTGHTFAGWYADEALINPYTFATLPATPITVYAKWNVNTYTVTWKLNGGNWNGSTDNKIDTVEFEGAVTKPADPTKEGYTFAGWEPAVNTTMGAASVEYVAQWTVNLYTITFVDEDGTTVLGSYDVEYGKMPTVPADPTKADTAEWDYTFTGWDSEVVAVSGDKTYKATYSAVKQKYTITWIVDGVEKTTTVEYGKTAEAPAYTVPANHEFVKWDVTPGTVTGEATYTAVLTLKTKSNPAIDKSNYSTEDLKDKVLTAVGLPATGDYTVTTDVGLEIPLIGLQTVTVIINNDSVAVQQGGNYDIAQLFAMALTDDTSRAFTITDNTTGVSKMVTVAISEDRLDPTYTVGNDSITVNADAVIDESWLKANLGIEVPSGQGFSLNITEEVPTLVAGNTYTITVEISIIENNEYKGLTETFTIQITVNDAFVKITDSNNITYNPEMSVEDITKYILENLTVQYNPQALKDMPHTIKYLANEATTVPVTVNLKNLDLGVYASFIPYDTITVDIPVAALWLDIGAAYPETTPPSNEKLEGIFNDLITRYGADLVLGRVDIETLKTEFKAILDADEDLQLYYQYLAAHKFGEMSQETIKIIVNGGEENGIVESNIHVIELTDDREETEIKLNSGVSVTYGKYTKESLMALVLDGVYANGTKLNVTVEFMNDVIGLPASESCEITVKFKGDVDHKPSAATTTIIINKAPVDVVVDNQIVKYGTDYNKLPVSTTPAGVETVQFIVGLDISNVNYDDGVKGIVGEVQLLLPAELQSMLTLVDDAISSRLGYEVSFADGTSMKLSDLQASLDMVDDLFTGSEYEEWVNVLVNMINSLPTETADVMVTVGGELPSDVGVYLIGAVSADANYETNFGVGVLAITPDGMKAELDWKMDDDNYIITRSLLTSGVFDTSAIVTSVAEGSIEEAQEQIIELFIGVDVDGNITLESDQTMLNVGAYIEVATIINWGNEMYYSEPIARPIVVVAEMLNVDFVDENGEINNERLYEFDNEVQNGMEDVLVTYKQDGEGYAAGDVVTGYTVKYIYAGVQTNGIPYAGSTAPVHAGAYTITAIVTLRDGDNLISHVGVGVGALVIEPTESDLAVSNKAVKYDGQAHGIDDMITATSTVPGLTPDTTIISAGITTDGSFSEVGLESITGTVNVDMPKWLDDVLKTLGVLEAGYTETGINASTFMSYIEKIQTALTDLGMDTESFDAIVDVIEQLPATAKLTFYDDPTYTSVGAYLVIGVVTDSDHYPSAGAGILVIYPDATKVELKFEEDWNNNNIFTWTALQTINLDASAYDMETGALNTEATTMVTNVYVGFNDDGEVVLTSDKATLDNGVYTQVAFLLDADSVMYYAEPISRVFVIVPTPATIEFIDENGDVNNERIFEFDNEQHGMDVRVTVNGAVIENPVVEITYVGLQNNGQAYKSIEAPTHAGTYVVTAVYTARDDQDRLVTLGAAVGAMVITPTTANIDVENEIHIYDGKAVDVEEMITASSKVESITPDTTIITAMLATDGTFSENGLSAITGNVNVDVPAWMDAILAKIDGVEDGVTAAGFIAAIEKAEATLNELAAEVGVEVDTEVFDKMITVIEQLPADSTLTFKDQDELGLSAVGIYLVIGVVTDSDHYPAMDAGILVIAPNTIKAELEYIQDWNNNNIFTLESLYHVDLGAQAYVDGALNADATAEVKNLYFTVDTEEWTIKVVDSQRELKQGVYTEFSFIADIDSVMYYAMPISRVIAIVPNVYTVEFENRMESFVYDATGKSLSDVTITDQNGEVVDPANGNLNITYIGAETSQGYYFSTEEPVHVGVYTVIATYYETDENGLSGAGATVGVLTITPAEAQVKVDSQLVDYGEDYTIDIEVTTDVKNDTPKTLTILAGVDTSKLITEGFGAIDGDIYIDFPEKADEILKQIVPGAYTTGVGTDRVLAQFDAIETALAEYGYESKVVAQLKKVLEQLPSANMIFAEIDDVKPVNMGTYAIVSMIFDPDYQFDMDTALLVINPEAMLVDLDFNVEIPGLLNIMPYELVEGFDFGVHANAIDVSGESVEFDGEVKDVIFGLTTDFEFFFGSSAEKPTELGVYDQIGYVEDQENHLYVSVPITRLFTVVASTANVEFYDKNGYTNWLRIFAYDGEPHAMPARLVYLDGTVSDLVPHVWYVGIEGDATGYSSAEAPTQTGVYQVIGYYIDEEANIYSVGLGAMHIEDADVVIIVDSVSKAYGEDDPELTYTVELRKGAVSAEELGITISRIAGETVGTYDIVVTYNESVNYDVLVVDADFVIEPKEVTVTVDSASKTYGDADPELTGTVEGLGEGETLNITYSREEGENVGEYVITATVAENPNYNVTVVDGALTINKKEATVVVDFAVKTYGNADPELTGTVSGLVGNDQLEVKYVREEGENGGTYEITAVVTENPNYNVTVVNNVLVIKAKTVTITVDDVTKVYGEEDPEFTCTIKGLVGEETMKIVYVRKTGENVGEYEIRPVVDGVYSNYVTVIKPGTLTITAKAATVTVDSYTKIYGEADPTLTGVVTGLVGEDALDIIYSREAGKDVGEYVIIATVAENPNYAVTVVDGTLTINKREIDVVIMDKDKIYGENDPEYTSTITNLVAGDELEITYSREAGENVGKYLITAEVAEHKNYEVTVYNEYLTIEAKDITVKVDDKTKFYGETDPEWTSTVEDLVGEDALNITYSRKDGEDAGEYTITAVVAENSNYNITVEAGTLKINKQVIVVVGNNVSKSYSEADPEFTCTVKDLVTGETLDIADELTLTYTRKAGENVGEYGIAIIVAEHKNYAGYSMPGTLTINAREVQITLKSDGTIEYNDEVLKTDVEAGKVTLTADTANKTVVLSGEAAENYKAEVKYVIVKDDYRFAQSVQIRLIEPWGLKANVRIYEDGANESNIDYSELYDYGVYFIRASKLDNTELTQETITKEDILNDVDAVHYTKDNGVEVKAGMLTAIYDKGIYTYELSDSIFVMYYIVPYEGAERIYVPIRERNLKELVGARKDSDYYPDEERAVYACMDLLEEDITNYRADFANAGDIKLQTVPTLGEYALSNGVTTGDYNFGHTVQISLIEPWGMKVNARVYNTGMSSSESIDYSTLKDYGVVVLYGSDVAVNSAEELLAREDAYVFSAVNGHASISGNVITAIYHQDVYTFELDTDAYVMFYVQDEDGYHFGPVKVRNLYDLMSARMNSTLSVYTEKEKKVYADMVELYHAITIYREWYFGQ